MSICLKSLADCQTTLNSCDSALTACDAALTARKEEVKLCNLALQQATDSAVSLSLEVKEKDAQLGAWYRNPFIMVALGAVAAAIIIK